MGSRLKSDINPDAESETNPPTLGVKFSNSIFIHPEKARQLGIEFVDEDLVDNPMFGKALKIR